MGINTVTTIQSYDVIKNREGLKQYLVLSFSNDFRDRIKDIIGRNKTEEIILVTFKEINPEAVVDWNAYVTFFMKTLKSSISHVIIDTEQYSEGYKLIQSCAINSESVKEISIWKEENDQTNYRIIAETEVNSPLSKKERTYNK